MKKFLSKIVLSLAIFAIMLICITNNVHAEANISKSRIYGNDRIQTSVKISQNGWQNGTDTVVIAQGYGYADALCASPLAKKYNAPILLSEKSGLNSDIIDEIKRLKAQKVFIIGGTGSLSTNVENQLKNIGIKEIDRLGGIDRYETSLKIAQSLGKIDNVVITSGYGYADSLSIASIAAQKCMPILLSQKDKLSDSALNYIKSMNVKNSYIVGGTGVISDNVKKYLPNPQRFGGSDRFETNLIVLQAFQSEINFQNIYIAEGDGVHGDEFADALSGSVLASKTSSPVVLIYKTMPIKMADFIKSKMSDKTQLVALGGTAVVSDDILNAVVDYYNGKTPTKGIANPVTVISKNPVNQDLGKTFTMLITRDNKASTIKTFTMTIDKDKTNENAMDYLKSVANVTENQGAGFVNGIDGLINIPLKDMPIEDRQDGYYGADWFIYLNNKLTDTGSLSVYPKAGDTLDFDYHKWDWHALVDPDYTGSMPLKIEDVPGTVTNGSTIKLRVSCVYRGVYGAAVKVDGSKVATTDIDGHATITMNNSGTHTVTVEKNGGSVSQTVVVSNSSGGQGGNNPKPQPPKPTGDLVLNTQGQIYDGSVSGNESEITGNANISANNISLQNIKVDGTITVDPGSNGSSNITNVTADKIIVKSGGLNSVHLSNVKANSLVVDSTSNVRVEAKDMTNIMNTQVESSSVLDAHDGFAKPFGFVTVNSDLKPDIKLKGNFENVNVEKEASLTLEGAQVSNLDVLSNITLNIDNTSKVDNCRAIDNVSVNGQHSSASVTGEKNIVNINNNNINLSIVENSSGNVRMQASSKNVSDSITLTLYDAHGNLSYVNQSPANGKFDFKTTLEAGKYHGFIKSSSSDRVDIGEFEIK